MRAGPPQGDAEGHRHCSGQAPVMCEWAQKITASSPAAGKVVSLTEVDHYFALPKHIDIFS